MTESKPVYETDNLDATLIACAYCQQGVRPRYAIHGLCADCARELIKKMWNLTNEVLTFPPGTDHIGSWQDRAIDIRVAYRLWDLDEDH